ncbi:diaminopimelate decarboxylase [Alphaproteobacteria bacterium]|nr:diaminopimelate decarboxylase [Alphaproteobacteria bacterium]
MNFFKYKRYSLFCENIRVAEVCKSIETPFYLYSQNAIIDNYLKISKLLKGTNTVIAYSVKANSNLSILKILKKIGAGADIVSIGELKRARTAGITSNKIVYSGVGKNKSEISGALDFNIAQFNVESLDELLTIAKIASQKNISANIALRVNPDITAGGHPKISTGKKTDKFGIALKEAKKVYAIARDLKSINVIGVDIHIGSQILNIKPFKKAFNKIIQFTNELEKDGHNIKNIDLGGGIGINYLHEEKDSNFLIEYTNLIKEVYKKTNKKIFIEPGRFLIANAGILITKVLYRKVAENKKFLIVDAGMNDFIRPALYDSKHIIKPVNSSKKINQDVYEVVGPICETADILIKKAFLDKTIKQDDYLFINNVGAYGAVMSSSYNSKDIANEVLVNKNEFSLIKEKIKTEDFLKYEKVAPWLKTK